MPRDPTAFDSLATPVARLDGSLRLMGANPAFGRWLGVGLRRLPGVPLDALEADGDVRPELARQVVQANGSLKSLELRRARLDEAYRKFFEEDRHEA